MLVGQKRGTVFFGGGGGFFFFWGKKGKEGWANIEGGKKKKLKESEPSKSFIAVRRKEKKGFGLAREEIPNTLHDFPEKGGSGEKGKNGERRNMGFEKNLTRIFAL